MESKEHRRLKDVAVAWLVNQGCFLAGTEVPLSRLGLEQYTDLDRRVVIDALGVGLRFNGSYGRSEAEGFDASSLTGCEAGECITRGVEVKVTRSDYRMGLTLTGCSFHYILTPMRLLAPYEAPEGVGLIEYNKYKFAIEETGDDIRPYTISGLRVIKRPRYRQVPRFQIDAATAYLGYKSLKKMIRELHFTDLTEDFA